MSEIRVPDCNNFDYFYMISYSDTSKKYKINRICTKDKDRKRIKVSKWFSSRQAVLSYAIMLSKVTGIKLRDKIYRNKYDYINININIVKDYINIFCD